MVRQRVRIRFRKEGDLRLIGHRDLVRTMERLFRRARLRLRMSQGYHPKPRMSLPCALAVGIEGLDEVMEVEMAQPYAADDLLARLGRASVPGLSFRSVDVLPPGVKKAQVCSVTYQVPIPVADRAGVVDRAERLMVSAHWPVRRRNRRAPVDLRRFLEALDLAGGLLSMRLRVTHEANPGPRDVLAALGLADLEQHGARLRRIAVELHG
jgi:radical SAM-linked protein